MQIDHFAVTFMEQDGTTNDMHITTAAEHGGSGLDDEIRRLARSLARGRNAAILSMQRMQGMGVELEHTPEWSTPVRQGLRISG